MTKSPKPTRGRLSVAESDDLRARLEEAEETLDAIRNGQVEALVVSAPTGPRVFTLEGADHRYRRLVETMNEGALLVSTDGLVLYANAAFAGLTGDPLERITGRLFVDFVHKESRETCTALIGAATQRPASDEISLRNGTPTLISMSPSDGGMPGISVIVTNLTAQKRNEETLASERLARSILDQSVEAIIICDENGVVTRASKPAQAIAKGQAVHQHVLTAFPLTIPQPSAKETPVPIAAPIVPVHPAELALKGKVAVGDEWTLDVPNRGTIHLLCTAAPLVNERGGILGCVLSLVDITRRKRAEAERLELLDAERAARTQAEKARAEAEASNRSKDEFLATVSHELRTPLNAIVGWARMITEGSVPEATHKKGLEVIRRNADAQARLIEDLLDVSRIISGKMRIDSRPVQPKHIIEAVLESVRPAADARRIALSTHFESDFATVLGDESRLQQIVWNLLSNAVKFTPREGKIAVTLRSDGSTVFIVVTDSGKGITADFLPYVFDRFRQADGGISRAHGGLGLGLAISRHLAELHGGHLEVASDGANAGSTFTLRLPATAERRPSTEDGAGPPASSPHGPLSFKKTNLRDLEVLIVEDDDDSREMLVSILTTCGARVRSTVSGTEALSLLEQAPADVLISDIGMPIMNGYSLIRRIRTMTSARLQKIPALALTAYARVEDRKRALSEGFQMHLAKPVDPSELAIVVASLARR